MTKHPVDETLPEVVMPSCAVHKTLSGQKALVTGASSGIGKGVALALSKAGADVVVNYASSPEQAEEVVAEIRHEGALRVLRPGGTLSSLGVYSGDLTIPLDAFTAGIGDHRLSSSESGRCATTPVAIDSLARCRAQTPPPDPRPQGAGWIESSCAQRPFICGSNHQPNRRRKRTRARVRLLNNFGE